MTRNQIVQVLEIVSQRVPLSNYAIRVIWAKINCHYYPFCQSPIFPKVPKLLWCKCKLSELRCERCGSNNFIVHHKAYCEEAVPSDKNNDWVKYYELLCWPCHRKEHYRYPELNNHKVWGGIISRTVGVGEVMWLDHIYRDLPYISYSIKHRKSRISSDQLV